MNSFLTLAAIGCLAVSAFLIVGRHGTVASPRIITGLVATLAGTGLLVAASFVGGPGVLAWIGLVVWVAASVYAFMAIRRARRQLVDVGADDGRE